MRAPFIVLGALTLLTGLAAPAHAFEEGQTCKLSRDVNVDVRGPSGRLTLPIDKGEEVTVVTVTPGRIRVRGETVEGLVDRFTLEEACRPAADRCQLTEPVKVVELPDGEGRAWRIKTGAILTVLERAPAFTQVGIGPVQGYVASGELRRICLLVEEDTSKPGEAAEAAKPQTPRTPVAIPPVTAGDKVVIVPFALDERADPSLAALVEDQLAAAIKARRLDLGGPGEDRPNAASRRVELKQHLAEIIRPARAQGLRLLITGRLTRVQDPAKAPPAPEPDVDPALEAPDDETEEEPAGRTVLRVVVFDSQEAKVLKTVITEPSLAVGHTWAREVAKALDEVLPAEGRKQAALDEDSLDQDSAGAAGKAAQAGTSDGPDGPAFGASDAGEAEGGSVLPWVGAGVLGVGGVAALAGAGLGAASLALALSAQQMPQTADGRQTFARASLGVGAGADAAWVIAGALAATGAALLVAGWVGG